LYALKDALIRRINEIQRVIEYDRAVYNFNLHMPNKLRKDHAAPVLDHGTERWHEMQE
jgi:hypothetical protein